MEPARIIPNDNSAPLPAFQNACDQLSASIDAAQFERLRWARTEAPMLAHLVELAQGAVEDRPDFELTDEGSGGAIRRFVVKVHGFRIVAVVIKLVGIVVSVDAEPIERSRYRLHPSEPVTAPYERVDGEWMAQALAAQFARVQA
jgi:hypothetical protein